MIRSRDFREGVVLRRRGLMPPHVRLTVWTTRGCIRIGRGLVLCRASRRCSPEKGVVSNACTRLYCREVALYERSKLPAACWCVREGGRGTTSVLFPQWAVSYLLLLLFPRLLRLPSDISRRGLAVRRSRSPAARTSHLPGRS